jgi:hypothetical protein
MSEEQTGLRNGPAIMDVPRIIFEELSARYGLGDEYEARPGTSAKCRCRMLNEEMGEVGFGGAIGLCEGELASFGTQSTFKLWAYPPQESTEYQESEPSVCVSVIAYPRNQHRRSEVRGVLLKDELLIEVGHFMRAAENEAWPLLSRIITSAHEYATDPLFDSDEYWSRG